MVVREYVSNRAPFHDRVFIAARTTVMILRSNALPHHGGACLAPGSGKSAYPAVSAIKTGLKLKCQYVEGPYLALHCSSIRILRVSRAFLNRFAPRVVRLRERELFGVCFQIQPKYVVVEV